MILTRTPYYIVAEHPNNFVTSVLFNVRVYRSKGAEPFLQREFNLTKQATGLNERKTYINISPYVNDFFNQAARTDVNLPIVSGFGGSAAPSLYVDVAVTISDSLGSDFGKQNFSFLAAEGYNYFENGINKESTKKILLSNSEYRVYENGYFLIPILVEDGSVNPLLDGNEIVLKDINNLAQNQIQYVRVNAQDYTGGVEFTYMGESVYLEFMKECKFPVNEVQFLNRYGIMEIMQFFKVRTDNEEIESSEFINGALDLDNYSNSKHQIQKIGVQGKGGFELESGFLFESSNETIKQLLYSESVFVKESFGYRPVNVDKSSIEFKTRRKDKLISYNLSFKNAHYTINNV